MSLAIQDKQARRRQPKVRAVSPEPSIRICQPNKRAVSPEPPSRDRAQTSPYVSSESDGDEYREAIGTCSAEPYTPLDTTQIPQTPQGDHSNCVAHAVATNIWLLLRHKYGERYTPNKRDILIIIMTCCNGCGPTHIEEFLSDCRQHFNRHNAKQVKFMVSGGKLIEIHLECRKVPDFDDVVELLKAQPVLVSVTLQRRDGHLVCALSAAGEGDNKHLRAYHSWEEEPNMYVHRDRTRCKFEEGYMLDVTIGAVFDDNLIKLSPRELLGQITRPNQMTKSSYEAKHAVVVQHEPVAPPALRHTINAFFSVLTRATVAGVSSAVTRLCGKRRREDGQ